MMGHPLLGLDSQQQRLARAKAIAAEVRERKGMKVGRIDRCGCDACKDVRHASSCAVHREPAYRNGPCSCGAGKDSTPG